MLNKLIFTLAIIFLVSSCSNLTRFPHADCAQLSVEMEKPPSLEGATDNNIVINKKVLLFAFDKAKADGKEVYFLRAVKGSNYYYYVFGVKYTEDLYLVFASKDNKTVNYCFKY